MKVKELVQHFNIFPGQEVYVVNKDVSRVKKWELTPELWDLTVVGFQGNNKGLTIFAQPHKTRRVVNKL